MAWRGGIMVTDARVAELADARDLKSWGPHGPCGFESHPGHFFFVLALLPHNSGRVSRHGELMAAVR